ncbi:MAG TPA: TatD family hydrolase [Treponemataceae bacterium]|nr:TatD family hydrolase [Treponemataceae bacterium]
MYSDTHCHLKHIAEKNTAFAIEMLSQLATKKTPLILDIGTESNDLSCRVQLIESIVTKLSKDSIVYNQLLHSLYFSAGIWPSVQEIKNRETGVKELEKQIDVFLKNSWSTVFSKNHLIALGECGLDHHWNPSGVDGRCENDFTKQMVTAEAELFEMQLVLAEKKKLPVIVHSRKAFDATLSCIKNCGYHNGVIHCYSYGLKEAKQFLDLGWYISFSGSITYTKKRNIEQMRQLLCYVPRDRMLCETDAPYLAPVPYRGKKNSPLLVKHVYDYVAEHIGVTAKELSDIVFSNACTLFKIKKSY